MFRFLSFLKFNKIRVRIAPSPTGHLHIGTARTALFNWLFAKKYGGKFILRIEDTDLERSDKKYEADIIEGLKWLGLDWDEGPYRQSERLDIYEKYLKKLLSEDKAYYCNCSKGDLEKEKQEQLKNGESPHYSGKCRNLKISPDQSELIRFKTPDEIITFKDLIRGEISFDTGLIGDIAIAKNLRTPLYNFAVVVDDAEMKISHVIRGEDHIANTPKQILIQKALDFSTPFYAHLPLILDPDRSKMSKRFSATSIQEYKNQGYLPETLQNFIAFLGWHPQGNKEKMSPPEITKEFNLERIQKGGAIFDIQKLNWLNGEYIKETSDENLLLFLKNAYPLEMQNSKPENNLTLVKTLKPRMQTLKDFFNLQSELQFRDYPRELLIWKNIPAEKILEHLKWAHEFIKNQPVQEFELSKLEKEIMPYANQNGRGEVLWPVRAALSGKEKSPGPFELMAILGKEVSLERIQIAIKKLENG